MCDQARLRLACAYAQSDQSICLSLEYSMTVKLLTEHHFGLLSLKGGCTDVPESTLVKMPHCWKSHVTAQSTTFFISENLTARIGTNITMLDSIKHGKDNEEGLYTKALKVLTPIF